MAARGTGRWVMLMAGVSAVLMTVSGCTSKSTEDEQARTSNDATGVVVTGLANGRSADVEDTGTDPNPSADLAFLSNVYDVGPDGPLDAPAHITIPLNDPAPPETVVVAATREDATQTWNYLPATLSADGTTASFDTAHFSLFGILGFDPQDIADQFTQQFLDVATGGLTAVADKPTCEREDDARGDGYRITSSTTDTVYWCFGFDETGRRILKVTNNVAYPLQVLHPNMQTLANPNDYLALSSLSRYGSGAYAIIAPGVTATFNADLGPGGSEGIRTEMDGVGQSLYALQVGFESLAQILTRLGVQAAKNAEWVTNAAKKALAVKGCADTLDDGPGGWFAGCLGEAALRAAFGSVALLLAPLAAIGAVAQFFRSEWHAIQDTVTSRDKYRIDITRGAAAVTADDLLSAPVPAQCEHPAGKLVNGELPVDDPMTGGVWIFTEPDALAAGPVFADLTGDGRGDAAAVTGCTAGGVNWPQTLVFYSPGPTLIGSVQLPTNYNEMHANVQTITAQGRDLNITFTTYNGAGFDFRYFAGRIHWDGRAMQLLDIQQTG